MKEQNIHQRSHIAFLNISSNIPQLHFPITLCTCIWLVKNKEQFHCKALLHERQACQPDLFPMVEILRYHISQFRTTGTVYENTLL